MSMFMDKLIYVLETTGEKISMMFDRPGKPCGCNHHKLTEGSTRGSMKSHKCDKRRPIKPPPAPISMVEHIEDITFKKISNYNYEKMSIENKKRLNKEYRIVSLDDSDFYGFWLLIPADNSVALRDSIDREIIADLIREAEGRD